MDDEVRDQPGHEIEAPPTPTSSTAPASVCVGEVVPFGTAVRAWFAISLQTFGSPAGQIAVMQRLLVEDKRWIGQHRFLHAMNYCMLLPGPEAQQLATYVGWLLHGTRGGLVAGGLFVLPGLLALLVLSAVYVASARRSRCWRCSPAWARRYSPSSPRRSPGSASVRWPARRWSLSPSPRSSR